MSPFAGPSEPFCKAQLQDKVQIEALLQDLVWWNSFFRAHAKPFCRATGATQVLLAAGLLLLFFLLDLASCQPPSCSSVLELAPSQLLGGPDPGLALGLSHWVDLQGCKSKVGRKNCRPFTYRKFKPAFLVSTILITIFSYSKSLCFFLKIFGKKGKKERFRPVSFCCGSFRSGSCRCRPFICRSASCRSFCRLGRCRFLCRLGRCRFLCRPCRCRSLCRPGSFRSAFWSCRCMPLVLVSCCIS